MSRSDAHLETPLSTINNITIEAVAQVEVELDSCDMNSMVFLLYDVPDLALQELTKYQRLSREDSNLHLLSSWARDQQTSLNWRERFLEALAICQLYNLIKKFGFNTVRVKDFFRPDNLDHNVHVNPMKKALYKLCDNTTSEELERLKKALGTYGCDTTKCGNCELVFLKLMSLKKITVPHLTKGTELHEKCDVGFLVEIIQNLPELQKFESNLKKIQARLNKDPKPTSSNDIFESDIDDSNKDMAKAFEDVCKFISELTLEEKHTPKNVKSDKQTSGAYKIRDSSRVGFCYIINQIQFHPSKESIKKNEAPISLNTRHGSNRDGQCLQKTFENLNFEVMTHSNLDHEKMKELITNIIEFRVQPNDSMFVLCILSHGIQGHVYAANSVQVKVEDIKNWLEKSFQQRKLEIPKLIILQACQVTDTDRSDTKSLRLVPDSLSSRYLRKAHFLVYWATAPELEAFRDEKKGSIFIQILCYVLSKLAKNEDVLSIFTKVNKIVSKVCTQLDKDQMPIFESTLIEKLYLQGPE